MISGGVHAGDASKHNTHVFFIYPWALLAAPHGVLALDTIDVFPACTTDVLCAAKAALGGLGPPSPSFGVFFFS